MCHMFRVALTASVLVILAAFPRAAVAQPRPNVVLIMTDDAGYGDFGIYGAPDIRTPNIDSLARDGVRFTDFYANGATCSPTRAALLSGRYQQRVAIEAPLGGARDFERGLPVTGRSLPQILKNSGYATALVGKWHLGYTPAFTPNAHGFDYFFGFKSGYTDYWQHTAGGDSPLKADLFENENAVQVPGYLTDLITERSERFIEQNARRPFFIDVAYNAPHWPYQDPDRPSVAPDNARHLGPFDNPTSSRADYVKMVERVDVGVGRILASLDRLGLRESTIVIFTNDNGGEWLSHGGPLFHHKGSVWEGGIRVPAIVRWPGRIPAGTVTTQVGITMDLSASILAATGTPVPQEARLEGMNLFPVLEARAPVIERTLFWRVGRAAAAGRGAAPAAGRGAAPAAGRGAAGITQAAAQQGGGQQAVRSGDWKLIVDGNRAMLFNLREDIGERTNVIGKHPDIARRLRPLLAAWQADVDADARRLMSGSQ